MPNELRGIVTVRWRRLRNEIRAVHFVLPTVTDVTLKLSTGTPLTFQVSFQLTPEVGAAAAGEASSTVSATDAAATVARSESPRRDAIDTTTVDWPRIVPGRRWKHKLPLTVAGPRRAPSRAATWRGRGAAPPSERGRLRAGASPDRRSPAQP